MTKTRLAVAWTVAILVLCTIPGDQLVPPPFVPLGFDKVVHVAFFLGFGALWTQALPHRKGAILLWGIAFGVFIEVWQGLLPIGRFADPFDALADTVGLVLGVGLAALLARRA